jgi:signal transduction histidine kinase
LRRRGPGALASRAKRSLQIRNLPFRSGLRASHAIFLLGVAFLAAVAVALLLDLEDLRRNETARAAERGAEAARAAEAHAARALDAAAAALERAREHAAWPVAARRGDDAALRDVAQRVLRAHPEARLVLLDAQDRARQVHPPGTPPQARDLARVPGLDELRRGAPGPLLAAAATGAPGPMVVASARLEDERGRHAGIAAVLLPPRSLLPRDIPAFVGIDIHLADGTLLATSRAEAGAQDDAARRRVALMIRAAADEDTLDAAGDGDRERILRIRPVAGWPAAILASTQTASLRGAWMGRALRHGLLFLALAAFTGVLVAFLARQVERHRETERRLREAVDNVTQAFAIFDAEDRVVLCTRGYAELFAGEDDPAALAGTTHAEVVARSIARGERPEDGTDAEAWARTCAERHDTPPAEPWVRRLAGGRYVLLSERRLPDGGTVAVGTEITEIKRREQQLETARRDAELASHSKSRFLASMSHELRTPLNAILGFSEIIRDQSFGRSAVERYADYAADIHRSGTHLLQLISDLLDTSKIEAGSYTLIEEVVDPVAVVEDAAAMLRDRARNAGIRLRLHADKDLPLVRADARALRQVVINLLANALKFTAKGGRAEVQCALDEQGWLAIAVGDTGAGIPEEMLPRLFQPFAQAHSHLVRSKEGAGLGLAISRGLVELHGGTIGIESIEGEGTVVTLRLPPGRLLPRPPAAG